MIKKHIKNLGSGITFGVGIFISLFLGLYFTKATWQTTNPGGGTDNNLYINGNGGLTADKWNSLVNKSIPSGAVMAFNLSACPSGWSEYTLAYGRVIRGIDKSGTNIDNDGQRVLGNIQEDSFQGHFHNGMYSDGGAGTRFADSGGANKGTRIKTAGDYAEMNTYWVAGNATSNNTNGTPRTANETRGKNVALLYCVKN